MPDFDLRALTLGPAFDPEVQDIPTPDFLTAQGAPDELLRLVGMSASELIQTSAAMSADEAENTGLLVAKVLRYRDAGGDDGKGTPVYTPTDTPTLASKKPELLNQFGRLVKEFLGLSKPIGQAVEAEKNGSSTTPSSDGGSGSPENSAAPTNESANQG